MKRARKGGATRISLPVKPSSMPNSNNSNKKKIGSIRSRIFCIKLTFIPCAAKIAARSLSVFSCFPQSMRSRLARGMAGCNDSGVVDLC